jgi:hypothetical protein
MRDRCTYHPGHEGVVDIGGRSYCERCHQAQQRAAEAVDAHVEPKPCFVWHQGGYDWQAIPGTGCAHWVAHEIDIHQGPSHRRCLLGYTFRVTDLVDALSEVKRHENVAAGDIFVNPWKTHCGLVRRVQRRADGTTAIEIEHDSSRQGGVFRNDFATYFKGQGTFYRKV